MQNSSENNDFYDLFYDPSPNFSQEAIDGIRFDFNNGFRIKFPNTIKKNYRIFLTDFDDKEILNSYIDYKKILKNTNNSPFALRSNEKYFIEYKLYIFDDKNNLLFSHIFDLRDRKVLIQCKSEGLGDNLAWIGIFDEFSNIHKCNLYVSMMPEYEEIFENQYKNINFITDENISNVNSYACYCVGTNLEDSYENIGMAICGIQNYAYHILGMEIPKRGEEKIPKLKLNSDNNRFMDKKYVCICPITSYLMKMWTYPDGWKEICEYLYNIGYEVVCLGKNNKKIFKNGTYFIPKNCRDRGGEKKLQTLIDIIKDADFFIGLSSGLSWLAWGCKIPVVMISGFTYPTTEFYTPYRVFPNKGCNSCFNNLKIKINKETNYIDTFELASMCPEKFNNKNIQEFECHMNITPKMVIDKINQIPCVKELLEKSKV